MDDQKKPYVPPKVTALGDATKQTRGFGGRLWEMLLSRPLSSGDDDLEGRH